VLFDKADYPPNLDRPKAPSILKSDRREPHFHSLVIAIHVHVGRFGQDVARKDEEAIRTDVEDCRHEVNPGGVDVISSSSNLVIYLRPNEEFCRPAKTTADWFLDHHIHSSEEIDVHWVLIRQGRKSRRPGC
jgi:hypothetical protein